jgi:hypothetical protein
MNSRGSIITNFSEFKSTLGKKSPGAPNRSLTCTSKNSKWDGTGPRGSGSRDISNQDFTYDNEIDALSGSVSLEQRDRPNKCSLPRDQIGVGLLLEPVMEGEENYEGNPMNDLADEEECFSPGRPMK